MQLNNLKELVPGEYYELTVATDDSKPARKILCLVMLRVMPKHVEKFAFIDAPLKLRKNTVVIVTTEGTMECLGVVDIVDYAPLTDLTPPYKVALSRVKHSFTQYAQEVKSVSADTALLKAQLVANCQRFWINVQRDLQTMNFSVTHGDLALRRSTLMQFVEHMRALLAPINAKHGCAVEVDYNPDITHPYGYGLIQIRLHVTPRALLCVQRMNDSTVTVSMPPSMEVVILEKDTGNYKAKMCSGSVSVAKSNRNSDIGKELVYKCVTQQRRAGSNFTAQGTRDYVFPEHGISVNVFDGMTCPMLKKDYSVNSGVAPLCYTVWFNIDFLQGKLASTANIDALSNKLYELVLLHMT